MKSQGNLQTTSNSTEIKTPQIKGEKEKSQVNNTNFHLKKLEKEEETKPKTSRRKAIINTRVEINELEKNKIIKTKSSLIRNKARMSTPITSSQYYTGVPSHYNMMGKKILNVQIGKEE